MALASSEFPNLSAAIIIVSCLLGSANSQITEGFGDITCLPGEYDADFDYVDNGYVNSGWGNCHAPEIGGEGAEGKFCFKALVTQGNESFVDWRCTCSTSWPLVGDACDEMGPSFVQVHIFYLIPLIANLLEFLRGQRIVRTMFKFNDGKINAANLSGVFMCILCWSETCRFATWSIRAIPGSYQDETFRPLQIFNAISATAVSEGLIGLALAWLDIAV